MNEFEMACPSVFSYGAFLRKCNLTSALRKQLRIFVKIPLINADTLSNRALIPLEGKEMFVFFKCDFLAAK